MRPRGRSVAFAVRVAVLAALIPVLAWGAVEGITGWTGVYKGSGTARAVGDTYTRKVTIFATEKGGKVDMLIQVAGTSVSAQGTPQVIDRDKMVVPFTVDDGTVSGSGEAVFERVNGVWELSATGEGSALGFSGEGGLVAKRRKTRMPSAAEQVSGTVRALGGSTDQSHVPPPADGPATITDPPQPTEPPTTKLTAMEYLFWAIMLIVLIFG